VKRKKLVSQCQAVVLPVMAAENARALKTELDGVLQPTLVTTSQLFAQIDMTV